MRVIIILICDDDDGDDDDNDDDDDDSSFRPLWREPSLRFLWVPTKQEVAQVLDYSHVREAI